MSPEDISTLGDLWTDADVTRFMGGPRQIESLMRNLEETAANPFTELFDCGLWLKNPQSK